MCVGARMSQHAQALSCHTVTVFTSAPEHFEATMYFAGHIHLYHN